MEDEKLRKQIGANIATYRKHARLTQAALAEKLNYSDKAISKWERGESVPDVITMVQLAELFSVSVDTLLADPDALPENPGAIARAMEKSVERTLKRKADKRVILGLSSILVWFVALATFVVLSFFDIPHIWLAFVYALPADAIVRLSLRSAWKDYRRNCLLISILMWGGLAALVASLLTMIDWHLWTGLWRILLLGIPGQLAILLWFKLFKKAPQEEKNG